MNNEIVPIKLEGLIDFKNGKIAPKKPGNIPIYGGNGILGYTNESNYENIIVIGRVGAYCGSVHIEKDKCWVSDNAIAGVHKQIESNEYNYYLLKCISLNKKQIGSSQPLLTQGILNNINVNVYSNVKLRAKIASVLSALDSKIELNNRINAELEAMAKTLYDYWFVQFEFPCLPENYKFSGAGKPTNFESCFTYRQVGGLPVPDGKKWFVYVLLCDDGSFYKGMTNDLYRRYYEHGTGQGAQHTKMHKPLKVIHWEEFESQGEAAAREKDLKTGFGRTWLQREYEYLLNYKPGLPAHNARPSKLMPAGKMVWNDELKREIPEGWEVKELGKYAKIKKGTLITGKTSNPEGKIKVVSAGLDFSYYHDIANYPENTITISASGASAGYINFWREPIFACDCTTVRGESDADTIHILGFLKMRQDFIYQQARGSAQPHVYPKDIEVLLLPTPPLELIRKFGELVLSANSKISNNIKENQKLAELRDWLLPMLMNGQVKVSER